MERAIVRRASTLISALVLVTAAACGAAHPQARPLRAAASPAPTLPDRVLGRTAPDEIIPFDVTLKAPDQTRLVAFLTSVQDPRSPDYRRFLDAPTFGARFGPSDADLAPVDTWLHNGGISVVDRYPQRTALAVTGRSVDVERLLHVRMQDFWSARDNRRYHAPQGTPEVPVDLRSAVDGIVGLDTSGLEHDAQVRAQRGLRPADLAQVYDIGPLHDGGIDGTGQTVAVISYDAINDSDVTAWDRLTGVSGPPVEHVDVQGGTSPGEGADEVALDVDVIRAVAPKAKILDFEAPNGKANDADMINAIVADGRADIATSSWGECDDPRGSRELRATRAATTRALQAAVARGITVFNASGDAGAFDCQIDDPSDLRPLPDFFSDSPYAVSVGGTYLTRTANGDYFDEAGWENPMERDGGGGGINPVEQRPVWQRGPGVDNQYTNGKRQVPDVAADADATSGYAVVVTDPKSREQGLETIGGTSGAAPFWAGTTVLIRQLAQQQGAGPLGFLDPILYDLAATQPPNTIFHDVVRGGNLLQDATPGWDYSTGLGSPIVTP
ncbi:MAG: S8/S53 family peptidase, partial [Acidimicrobiia bacterium]|nr:S8/S53 family peptidase [Acidimicrobiia bacterium]